MLNPITVITMKNLFTILATALHSSPTTRSFSIFWTNADNRDTYLCTNFTFCSNSLSSSRRKICFCGIHGSSGDGKLTGVAALNPNPCIPTLLRRWFFLHPKVPFGLSILLAGRIIGDVSHACGFSMKEVSYSNAWKRDYKCYNSFFFSQYQSSFP